MAVGPAVYYHIGFPCLFIMVTLLKLGFLYRGYSTYCSVNFESLQRRRGFRQVRRKVRDRLFDFYQYADSDTDTKCHFSEK